jgi:hypothetical protein
MGYSPRPSMQHRLAIPFAMIDSSHHRPQAVVGTSDTAAWVYPSHPSRLISNGVNLGQRSLMYSANPASTPTRVRVTACGNSLACRASSRAAVRSNLSAMIASYSAGSCAFSDTEKSSRFSPASPAMFLSVRAEPFVNTRGVPTVRSQMVSSSGISRLSSSGSLILNGAKANGIRHCAISSTSRAINASGIFCPFRSMSG